LIIIFTILILICSEILLQTLTFVYLVVKSWPRSSIRQWSSIRHYTVIVFKITVNPEMSPEAAQSWQEHNLKIMLTVMILSPISLSISHNCKLPWLLTHWSEWLKLLILIQRWHHDLSKTVSHALAIMASK
jgi:hypothetical protein